MAKITANGATEVARIKTTSGRYSCLWVINSRGTVLWRYTGDNGSYTVKHRNVKPVTRERLIELAWAAGHRVESSS